VDVVFDPVCGPLFEPAFRSLAWNGRHLVVGFASGEIPALKANLPLLKGAALMGVDVRQAGIFEPEKMRAGRELAMTWFLEGKVSSPHGKIFPFEKFKDALEFALSGKGAGKTILEIAS
ncbi:MAG: zinc-binding dehydrogenase, partial [Caulobacterales bacterium]